MTKLVLLLSIVSFASAYATSSGSTDVSPDAAPDATPDAVPADLAADEDEDDFAASEALDDPAKKEPWLQKAHQAMDDARAAGGLGFGTEFAHLGAAQWYPNGFGVGR